MLLISTYSYSMITCSYCDSKIEDNRFCSSKHKMAFYRHGGKILHPLNVTHKLQDKQEVLLESNIEAKVDKITKEKAIVTCKHGNTPRLCKSCILGKK